MSKAAPILISRSAVATRKLCEMKRFRGYHQLHPDWDPSQQKGGISPLDDLTSGFDKLRGQLIHSCLDMGIKGQDWQSWLISQPAMLPQPFGLLDEENQLLWSTLIRRSVQGWLDIRWSKLSQDYEPVSSEEEWQWSLSPLVNQSLRMDQIWRRRSDGQLLIVDFKTLKRLDANWVDRLRNSDQTHLYVQALVERTQEPVLGIQYEGLILGSKDKDGRHKSELIGAYSKGGLINIKWSNGAQYYGTLHWADQRVYDLLGQVGLENLYPTTGPLYPPPSQLLQTKDATAEAEINWADRMSRLDECRQKYGEDSSEYQSLLGRLVERSSDACLKYGWGYACPYMDMCWNGAQPDQETFQPRIDHHVEEAI